MRFVLLLNEYNLLVEKNHLNGNDNNSDESDGYHGYNNPNVVQELLLGIHRDTYLKLYPFHSELHSSISSKVSILILKA